MDLQNWKKSFCYRQTVHIVVFNSMCSAVISLRHLDVGALADMDVVITTKTIFEANQDRVKTQK